LRKQNKYILKRVYQRRGNRTVIFSDLKYTRFWLACSIPKFANPEASRMRLRA
jgi:hypothetical protein